MGLEGVVSKWRGRALQVGAIQDLAQDEVLGKARSQGLSGSGGLNSHSRMRVLDGVIHGHLNDRIARLDGQRCLLRGFRCRVGPLGLPVHL
jgi:hypothetical protein